MVVANWKKPIFVSRLIATEKKIMKPAMFVMIAIDDTTALVNMRQKLWREVGVMDDSEDR